ncbi:hypothetical protein AUK11_02600 [bacterium CG2_30_37_16]|nr:MAG: hypothetical protein AUK11_02600 [bacterium CG2_30_37_16]PIP30968.1 MAG: 4Fe-4S ferredoxin [bacterium (Candidatus Howlettbacteria) CG23_combo_of_CG06-09_8_20_14_all_37_9]PJB05270.1 MAG: 4Fe-4S ferredoxin [bacterium (Candidatus Howlettbacteria) CG_4_9_14_3_um_filter_37_10]
MYKPVSFENGERKWTNFLEICKGCGICIEKCPQKCLKFSEDNMGYYSTPAVDCDIDRCIVCKTCEMFCPDVAINVNKKP